MVPELNKTVSQILNKERAALAEAITATHYELNPELAVRYGERGRVKCLEDAHYHLSYLADAIAVASRSLFADYIGWAKVMLSTRGIPAADLARNLSVMTQVLRERLAPEMGTLIERYVDAGLEKLPSLPSDLPTLLSDDAPHAGLAREFLRLLLNGERQLAGRLIQDAVAGGAPLKEIYLHVFQATQREMGRLWQMNQVNVAQEHYCTAATQLIMAQLYPYLFRGEKNGRRIVATSTAGELHEIGIRIITDFFEMDGWDTYYLGANSPASGVVQALADRDADVLAISATMTFHIGAVENLIAAVRANEAVKGVKILVGGYPFIVEPELWQRVGADACATDASEAVALAERLVDAN